MRVITTVKYAHFKYTNFFFMALSNSPMTGLDINKFNFKKPYQFNTAVVLRTNVVRLNYRIKHLKQFRALNGVSDVELVTAIACQVPQVIETHRYLQVKSRKILSMKIGISYPFHQACTTSQTRYFSHNGVSKHYSGRICTGCDVRCECNLP